MQECMPNTTITTTGVMITRKENDRLTYTLAVAFIISLTIFIIKLGVAWIITSFMITDLLLTTFLSLLPDFVFVLLILYAIEYD